MLSTTAVETANEYILTVTDGTNTWETHWGKQIPTGQTVANYLQSCKTEAERLAQWEIDQTAAPTPVAL